MGILCSIRTEGPLTSNLLSHMGSLPYDPDDLLPISAAAEVYVAIGVPTSLATNSLSDFVAQARSKKGQFNWSGTPGSLDYLVPGFLRRAGIDLHAGFIPRSEPGNAGPLRKSTSIYVAALATQLPMAQVGKIKIIAITSSQRSPSLPDVPTAREVRFRRNLASTRSLVSSHRAECRWSYVSASAPICKRSRRMAILADRFNPMGMGVRVTSPAELQKLVTNERAALRPSHMKRRRDSGDTSTANRSISL